MDTKPQKNLIPQLAGGAFALMAAYKLMHLTNGFSLGFALGFICCAALSVLLFVKNRSLLIGLLIAILAFPDIYWQLYNVGWEIYAGDGFVFLIILNLLYAFSHISLIALSCVSVSKYKDKSKLFYFVPAGLMAAGHLALLFQLPSLVTISLESLLQTAAYALLSVWLAYPEGLPTKSNNARSSEAKSKNTNAALGPDKKLEKAYCELGRHIVLLLFTLGIYHLIWVYRTSAYVCTEDKPTKNPIVQLLLYLFVPFYFVYWTYISARRIDSLAVSKGIGSKCALVCTVVSCISIPFILSASPVSGIPLAFFMPLVLVPPSILIVPPIIMQSKMNAIAFTENEYL